MSKTLLRFLLDNNIIDEQKFATVSTGNFKGDMQVFTEIRRRDYAPDEKLLRAVSEFYDLEYIESTNGMKINMPLAEKLGGVKEMQRCLFIPLQDGTTITSDPFLKIPIASKIKLTTRENIIRMVHAMDHIGPISAENPDESLQKILSFAVAHNASDVHIYYEPFEKSTIVKLRIDGLLKIENRFTVKNPDKKHHDALINKIFDMAGIDPSQFRDIWDKSFSVQVMQKDINVRVSCVPLPEQTAAIVMRLLYQKDETIPAIETLGFDTRTCETLKHLIRQPFGLVLISGPTGSGKTTTLYSLLNEKRKEPINIVSIEDPVEARIPGIRQVEVKKKEDQAKSITFASATRAFLRHDPDVILIGEIRDEETAKEAMKAAQTGHLVFATIHTNTACGVIYRLMDLGISKERIATVLKVSLAQRLVRGLCPHCVTHVPYEQMLEDPALNYYAPLFKNGVYKPVGCPECGDGYKGRIPLWEMVAVNKHVKKIMMSDESFDEDKIIRASGFENISKNAWRLVEKGLTTIDEAARFVSFADMMSATNRAMEDKIIRVRFHA